MIFLENKIRKKSPLGFGCFDGLISTIYSFLTLYGWMIPWIIIIQMKSIEMTSTNLSLLFRLNYARTELGVGWGGLKTPTQLQNPSRNQIFFFFFFKILIVFIQFI